MPGRQLSPDEREAQTRAWFLGRVLNETEPGDRIARAADYLRASCEGLPKAAAMALAEESATYLIDLANRARNSKTKEVIT